MRYIVEPLVPWRHIRVSLINMSESERAPALSVPGPMEAMSNIISEAPSSAIQRSAIPLTSLPPNHNEHGAMAYADDIAGIYTPLLRMRKKRCLPSLPVVPLPPHVIGGLRDQIEKIKICNCKRSNCLKLYCDCFQSGLHCGSMCNCQSCKNLPGPDFCAKRTQAILVTLDRNPNAFRPRTLTLGELQKKERGLTGCNCKKTLCLKKYCECFHAMVYCSEHCKCSLCNNIPGVVERERLMNKRRSKEETVAAAAAAHQQHSRMSGHMSMDRIREGRDDVTEDLSLTSGIDPFIPVGSYAIPIKVVENMTYGALSFGNVDHANYSKGPVKIYGARRLANKQLGSVRPGRYTEAEGAWRKEADRTYAVFGAVKNEIKRRKGEQVVDIPIDPDVKKYAVEILDSVTRDMLAVTEAVEYGKRRAVHDFNNKQTNSNNQKKVQSNKLGEKNKFVELLSEKLTTESPSIELACKEVINDAKCHDLSKEGGRQLAILVAQDAAMLSQLAKIIKSKALEMTEARLKIN